MVTHALSSAVLPARRAARTLQRGGSGRRVAAAPPARRTRVATSASAALGVLQLAPALAWGFAGVYAVSVFWGGQQSQTEEDAMPRRECESCGGTGQVECWCARWSDGDQGCSTCRGSGRMTCSSCRGGGTAVPIEARIVIKPNERTSNFRNFR